MGKAALYCVSVSGIGIHDYRLCLPRASHLVDHALDEPYDRLAFRRRPHVLVDRPGTAHAIEVPVGGRRPSVTSDSAAAYPRKAPHQAVDYRVRVVGTNPLHQPCGRVDPPMCRAILFAAIVFRHAHGHVHALEGPDEPAEWVSLPSPRVRSSIISDVLAVDGPGRAAMAGSGHLHRSLIPPGSEAEPDPSRTGENTLHAIPPDLSRFTDLRVPLRCPEDDLLLSGVCSWSGWDGKPMLVAAPTRRDPCRHTLCVPLIPVIGLVRQHRMIRSRSSTSGPLG